VILLPFAVMMILLLLGVPIAFSIAGAGILGIWITTGDLNTLINILGTVPYSTASVYVLTTIPMFILMAFLSSSGGLAKDLFTAGSNWLSHIRGGVAIGSVFATMIFGAMSGVSLAAASAMSEIAIPNMRRIGYSDALAAGTVGVGATTDILIPPSVGLVIYGIATETSIGKLLLAGVIPGLIVCFFLILCIIVWVAIRPSDAPKVEKVPWSQRWRSLNRVWPSFFLIFMVLILLYSGICTPTEVGAVGALMAGIIGRLFGRLTLAGAAQALKATIRITTMIFMILIGTFIFSYYIALSKVPQMVIAAVTEMNLNRWIVILGIAVGYFVISMFMDELALLLITLQLTFPLIIALKFDPIWFGIFSVMLVSMGLIFPPVGMCAFVVSAVGKIQLTTVFKGTSIMMIAIILTTVLLIILPEIALWLPSKMGR
jgi:tripartite ATP-independent transporter DctM subunit